MGLSFFAIAFLILFPCEGKIWGFVKIIGGRARLDASHLSRLSSLRQRARVEDRRGGGFFSCESVDNTGADEDDSDARDTSTILKHLQEELASSKKALQKFFKPGDVEMPLPKYILRGLFVLSIRDSVISVVINDNYCSVLANGGISNPQSLITKAVSKIWLSALGPRTLFLIGFVFRGMFMETGLEGIFSPSVGVCSLVNMGANWVGAFWIPKLVLGYKIAGRVWRLFDGGD
mgnify:CR=1 FL=1